MTATMADHAVAIAQDMFTAMIDGEPGLLTDGHADALVLPDPVHAWVEIEGDRPLRTLVATGRDTADRLTRVLLVLEPEEPVGPEDLRDALGEVANVIGGNLKGLMPEPGSLTLPVVTLGGPEPDGALLWQRSLEWHQDPLIISLWDLDEHTDGKETTS